jgi:DNA-binding transcriptional LysR family regulator
MLTIKQLQAFYWVARLGTLNKAAEKLHITQSAATKRLQEVQAAAAGPLFEGEGRKSRLTRLGRDLERECERLFEQLQALDQLKRSGHPPVRVLKAGLTEMVALTWFPDFLKRMKDLYPSLIVQPEIDLSMTLQEKLQRGDLDFAILPDHRSSETIVKVGVGDVKFGWFSAPGIFPADVIHSLQTLASKPMIEQSENSIITLVCNPLWESAGVRPERIYGGNNIQALAGLVAAGIGISCLPVQLFRSELRAGSLVLVKASVSAPTVTYSCCFLKHPDAALGHKVAEVARQSSTFGRRDLTGKRAVRQLV